ncbi:MAG: hypothetical protein M3N45_09365 [Actinomycetota bacterium]|nr:hypothetical protein [Actinomycetota bacterium]
MNSHLINKDQRLGIHNGRYGYSPEGSLELVALCGYSSPFFLVEPIRAMARQIVERLTESPVRAYM